MESRDISPQNAFFNTIADLAQRVKSLETRPAGEIVIRESILTTDPTTGVDTLFGQLPDGTVGVQPWINDITPPDKPATPSLSSVAGVLTVEWDGLDHLGLNQPKDYDRTVVEMSTNGLDGWIAKDTLRGKGRSMVNGEPANEYRYFRLISFDQNNNSSVPSNIVSKKNTVVFDDTEFQFRFDEVHLAVDNKSRNWYLDTAPGGTDHKTGDVWFDKSNGNMPMSWNAITNRWVSIQDTAIESARETAVSALSSADGKNTNYYQGTKPTGGTYKKGDIWFDTANSYKMYTYDGQIWEGTQDSATAISTADQAQETAEKKNSVYYSETEPTGSDYKINDMWFQSPRNTLHRWAGPISRWVAAQDSDISEAFDTATTAATDILLVGSRLDSEILPAIEDAAASPVTDSRLSAGSLTVWPFKQQAIPAGSFVPGAVGGGDIADFTLAVTKLKSERHFLY